MARTDTVFVINNIDFSNHVIAGTYDVNNESMYVLWQDANGRNHRDEYRKQLKGSFDMFFVTVDEFEEFNQAYKSIRDDSGLTTVRVLNNSSNSLETKQVYLSFAPIRNRRDNWEDYYEQFTVSIEEW